MRKLFLLLPFIPAIGFASICTSSGNGNWDNAATWTGCRGGVPGNGDTAIIANASTVTIPSGYQAIVGLSQIPGDESVSTAAVKCSANNGTGKLVINGTFTFRGNVEQCHHEELIIAEVGRIFHD